MLRLIVYLTLIAPTLTFAEHESVPPAREEDPSASSELKDMVRVKIEPAVAKRMSALADDMEGGFCGPTSAALSAMFLGEDVDPQEIRNFSWTSGFHCVTDLNSVLTMWPTTTPFNQMKNIARQLGLEFTAKRDHKSADEAKDTIIRNLDAGQPVVVNWQGHLVMVYGYGYKERVEKDGVKKRDLHFLIHDPRDAKNPFHASEDFPIGFGSATVSRYADWTSPPRSWGLDHTPSQGFPVYIYKKGKARPPTDWADVWRLHAERTRGEKRGADALDGKTATPFAPKETFGVKGIRECASKFPDTFATSPLHFADVFHLGETSRRDLAAFLAKKAAAATTPEAKDRLTNASAAFLRSADLFRGAQAKAYGFVKPRLDSLMEEEIKGGRPTPQALAERREVGIALQTMMVEIASQEEVAARALERLAQGNH